MERSPIRATSRWMPWWVAGASLALTLAATFMVNDSVNRRRQVRFQNAVQSTSDRIQTRVEIYVSMLLGARGLFAASRDVSSAGFKRFVDALEVRRRYPGLQGIGFSRRILPGEREAVEAAMRAQGLPGFRVWPLDDRAEAHSIVFLEPQDRRNQAAMGFDMASDPVRREAMERARDSGQPAASRRVILVQEIDVHKQPGFLIYLPVYTGAPTSVEERRRQLIGFVYAPLRTDDLLRGIFGTEQDPRVSFTVYDGSTVDNAARIHESKADGIGGMEGRLTTTALLDVVGTPWTIAYRSRESFDAAGSRWFPFLLLGAGLLASVALFFMTRGQVRARAEAEVQRNNLHRLLMQAPAAIAILRTPDLRYELSNPLNREFAGGRELVGRTVEEALPESVDPALLEQIRDVVRTGTPIIGTEVPFTLPQPDGSTRQAFINGTYQPLRDGRGNIIGVIAFAYEVTELVQARLRAEALADDLGRAVRARDDFLSVAGHELKTPLTALQLQLEMLRRQLERQPDDLRMAQDKVQKATAHVVRVGRLVDELLDVSRITTGRLLLSLERVDLVAVVKEVVDRHADQLARAGCTLSVEMPAAAEGNWDRLRMEQVVTNLLTNAIKYGPANPIALRIAATADGYRVEVEDHGIGIPDDDVERIFGRFERAVSERTYAGLGLGLWISRQIVEALGGSIRCDSQVGVGSTFIVQLPAAGPPRT